MQELRCVDLMACCGFHCLLIVSPLIQVRQDAVVAAAAAVCVCVCVLIVFLLPLTTD